MIYIPSIRSGLPFENSGSLFLTTITGGGFDPDVLAYISALNSAGTIVTSVQQTAIETFIVAEKAANRWDKIKRFYLPIWGAAAPNAICMKSLTSGTFTGGAVTHGAGYVVSSYNGGYMNTNSTFPALQVTKDGYHFAVLYKTIPFGGDNYSDNAFGVSNVFVEVNDGNSSYTLSNESLNINNIPIGVFSLGGNASTRYVNSRNALGVNSLLSQTPTLITSPFATQDIYFLARNGYNLGSSTQMGAFSIATELTAAEDLAYTANLKALWETCTGLTLP